MIICNFVRIGDATSLHTLSPPKLHPVLRIKHAEKDWFTTVQKNNFLWIVDERVFGQCEINCFLGIGRIHVPRRDGALSARGLTYLRYWRWTLLRNHKNRKDWRLCKYTAFTRY